MIKNTGETANDIEFTRKMRITLANKILISPKLKILQFLLIAAGVYGTLLSFISGLNVPVYETGVIVAILISVTYFYILYLFPSVFKYSLLIFCLLYFVAGYIFLDEIKNGFWNLENIYITGYNLYYGTSILKFLVDDYNQAAVITIFFIFVAILLSLVLCSIILKNSLRFLFGIITLPIVALPFTVGKIPSFLPFCTYSVCVMALLGMGTTRTRRHIGIPLKGKRGKNEVRFLEQNFRYVVGLKTGGHLAVLFLILLLFSGFMVTPDLYDKKLKLEDTRRKIQKEMMEFSLEDTIHNMTSIRIDGVNFFKGLTATGGLSRGKLGRIGEVNFNYRTALKVQVPDTGKDIYLKGFVGSQYKGNYWDGLSCQDLDAYKKIAKAWDNSDFTIANMTSYYLTLIKNLSVNSTYSYKTLEFMANDMTVEMKRADRDYIYTPYYTEYEADMVKDTDTPEYVLPAKRQNSYHLKFYNCLSDVLEFDENREHDLLLYGLGYPSNYTKEEYDSLTDNLEALEKYGIYEKTYRKFVYDVYTRLPEKGLEQVIKDYGNTRYGELKEIWGSGALSVLTSMVREKLNQTAVYSLSPGTLPKDKDFIEYFLYENKTGYCSHFASAATMIFRTMGIPARYVEGYVVRQSDIAKGEEAGSQIIFEEMGGRKKKVQITVKSVNITDANAHAWVEIYVDGFGWAPVEVTPGFGGSAGTIGDIYEEGNQTGQTDQSLPDVTPTQAPQDKEKQEKDKKEPLTEKDEKDSIRTDKKEKGKEDSKAGYAEPKGSVYTYIIKTGFVILWILVILSSVFLLTVCRAFIILSKRNKAWKRMDYNQKVLQRYREIQRILTYYNIKTKEDLTYKEAAKEVEKQWNALKPDSYVKFMDIVLKARFHPYSITKDEAEKAEQFYKEIIALIYTDQSFFKRFILRFIKVFY